MRPWGGVLAATASGLALVATFDPWGLGPVAWIALLPLLRSLRGATAARRFLLGWITGTLFFAGTAWWLVETFRTHAGLAWPVSVAAVVLLAALPATFMGLFVVGVGMLPRRRWAMLIGATALWVGLEWLRSWGIDFPWLALGYSQVERTGLVQLSEVTGIYGVSAVVVFVNLAIAAPWGRPGEPRRRVVPLAAAALLVALLSYAGRERAAAISTRPPLASLRVAVVQGEQPWPRSKDPRASMLGLSYYASLSRAAAETHPALVVWPESSLPIPFSDPGYRHRQILSAIRGAGVPVVLGSRAAVRSRSGNAAEVNRAYLLDATGRVMQTYDKNVLVPFGEYVPLGRLLSFLRPIASPEGNLLAGDDATVMRIRAGRFGVLICYESVFSTLARRLVRAGAEFLVNISNDAWFGRSAASALLLTHLRVRAIEYRVPIVRATSGGVSAFVDATGRVTWRSKSSDATWSAAVVSWPGIETLYARWGDAFAVACLGIGTLLLLAPHR